MAWSTRELAELAGTTVNTVRHYHRLGLLEEPEREYNGYKQYSVQDLVRLLRIRRLVDLGVPLARIAEVGGGGEDTPEALRQVDAELAASIERLQRARSDIAAILQAGAPADAPAGFESVASRLSQADNSIIHIYTKLFDERAMADLRKMVEVEETSIDTEFNALLPDADEATRQRLAAGMAPGLAQHLVDYPWLSDPSDHISQGERVTRETFVEAVVELYNPAQLNVLARASEIARAQIEAAENPT